MQLRITHVSLKQHSKCAVRMLLQGSKFQTFFGRVCPQIPIVCSLFRHSNTQKIISAAFLNSFAALTIRHAIPRPRPIYRALYPHLSQQGMIEIHKLN